MVSCPSTGLGDYNSAPCQDPQQLRDERGFVPARPLPQEAEAGVDAVGPRRGTGTLSPVSPPLLVCDAVACDQL